MNWRKALARKRSSDDEFEDTSIGSPDWSYMYGRRSYPLEDYRPRRKTAEEREREEDDRRHEEFVEDMKEQGRWDAVHDPEFAAIAYDRWEAKKYPPKYAKRPWE
jgi:hypothetical protein